MPRHRGRVSLTTATIVALIAGHALAHPAHPDHEHEPGSPGQEHRHQASEAGLPVPQVTITVEGDFRVIRSNGLPGHDTGEFPNRGNPNALRAQNHEYRVPLNPQIAEAPTAARPEFGIGVNGVVFDAGTGEFWTANRTRTFGGGSDWNYEALGGDVPLGLDDNHAHVQPTGKYHYHGVPTGLLDRLGGEEGVERMILVGWAFDGFPIYGPYGYSDANDASSEVRMLTSSYAVKDGERPAPPEGPGGAYDGTFGLDYEYLEGSGDLDECNGRFGVTPEFPEGTYYYVITEDFPQIPRMWRGTPDESLRSRRGGGPRRIDGERDRPRGPRRRGRGPRPDSD
ncbi:MAG: YHYH protein [Phycisphaerales bacterium]